MKLIDEVKFNVGFYIRGPDRRFWQWQNDSIQRGRPAGTTTYEAEPAIAFWGSGCGKERTDQGDRTKETLAHLAGSSGRTWARSSGAKAHSHLPSVLKIARALKCSSPNLNGCDGGQAGPNRTTPNAGATEGARRRILIPARSSFLA